MAPVLTVCPVTTVVPRMLSLLVKLLPARDNTSSVIIAMLENLGLLGLFIGCALSATIVPFLFTIMSGL